jgi:hypothetical protein
MINRLNEIKLPICRSKDNPVYVFSWWNIAWRFFLWIWLKIYNWIVLNDRLAVCPSEKCLEFFQVPVSSFVPIRSLPSIREKNIFPEILFASFVNLPSSTLAKLLASFRALRYLTKSGGLKSSMAGILLKKCDKSYGKQMLFADKYFFDGNRWNNVPRYLFDTSAKVKGIVFGVDCSGCFSGIVRFLPTPPLRTLFETLLFCKFPVQHEPDEPSPLLVFVLVLSHCAPSLSFFFQKFNDFCNNKSS